MKQAKYILGIVLMLAVSASAYAYEGPIFHDDFDDGSYEWTSTGYEFTNAHGGLGLWHIDNVKPHSGNASWVYNSGYPLYTVDIGEASFATLMSPFIDLTDVTDPILTFWEWEETYPSPSYQKMKVYVRTEDNGIDVDQPGNIWQQVYDSHKDARSRWARRSVDLSEFEGQRIQLGFFFIAASDGSINDYFGWSVDDVEVRGKSDSFIPPANNYSEEPVPPATPGNCTIQSTDLLSVGELLEQIDAKEAEVDTLRIRYETAEQELSAMYSQLQGIRDYLSQLSSAVNAEIDEYEVG